MLAAKVLMGQGIKVTGLCFESNFFSAKKARLAAKSIGIELKISDISKEILALVKNPPNGYGKNMNPCIDCHGLMIKEAGKTARQDGFDFIATGEVLGQRPYSQNKSALAQILKISGVEVLRPLSAKLLRETEVEKNGFVIRGKLHGISGRTRDKQIYLAEKYNIKQYESPAGGCLLTDPKFSERLLKLLDYWPDCSVNDVELLKHGRVFWVILEEGSKAKRVMIIIGRHQTDNNQLEFSARAGDYLLELKEINGPMTLVRNLSKGIDIKNLDLKIPEKLMMSKLKISKKKTGQEILQIAAFLTGYYAAKARGKEVSLETRVIN